MDSPKNPQLHLMRGKKKKKQAALNTHLEQFVVHSPSCVQLFVTPWMAAHQAFLSSTISQSLLKLMSTESVMPSNHLILCCPLFPLPSIFPRVFSNKSAFHIRWPKQWSFSFSISPSNKDSGLIYLKINCFDFLAVQQTLQSLFQHHSLKALIFRHSAFFMISLSLRANKCQIYLTIQM